MFLVNCKRRIKIFLEEINFNSYYFDHSRLIPTTKPLPFFNPT